jgi:septum site-determining protein MinC
MSIDTPSKLKTALEFKSTSLTVPVLLLTDLDLERIALQLKEKVAQAPEFFKDSPLLIDLQKLTGSHPELSVEKIISLTRENGFMPIGVRGGNDLQIAATKALNLPVFSIHSQNQPLNEKKSSKSVTAPKIENGISGNKEVENKLIVHPVRSGQRVYAKGDLIVTATVSAGAEIMAEGNIHIYGSLRGKALAGVLGNTESRIFCSDLQAELISIAGIYQLRDDLSSHVNSKPVQISLNNQTLIIKEI